MKEKLVSTHIGTHTRKSTNTNRRTGHNHGRTQMFAYSVIEEKGVIYRNVLQILQPELKSLKRYSCACTSYSMFIMLSNTYLGLRLS